MGKTDCAGLIGCYGGGSAGPQVHDEVCPAFAPRPLLCPEFPVALAPQVIGSPPQLKGGLPCIGLHCAKYQACQVMPGVMAKILSVLEARLA